VDCPLPQVLFIFLGVRVGERIRPPGTWFQLVEPACARTGCFPGPQLRQASGAFSRQGKAGPHAFNSHLRRAMVFFSSSLFNLLTEVKTGSLSSAKWGLHFEFRLTWHPHLLLRMRLAIPNGLFKLLNGVSEYHCSSETYLQQETHTWLLGHVKMEYGI
jgi:hypothetical protein